MRREKFLKTLQYFDENFNAIVNNDKEWDKFMKDYKWFNDKEKSSKYSQSHSHIDIQRVRQITQSDNNCFTPLYDLDDDLLFHFFSELSKVGLGLIYFNDFSENYRTIKESNRNQSKQNKIDEVMEMLNEDSINYETTMRDLERLRNTLNNNHFTKRQLFEHLLIWVALLLNDMKQSREVANITNKIIEDYFDQNITFSKETKIDNFEPITYHYTDAKGIILYHS